MAEISSYSGRVGYILREIDPKALVLTGPPSRRRTALFARTLSGVHYIFCTRLQ